eukprot:1211293-Pleurochrysis_carterae.AAC.5
MADEPTEALLRRLGQAHLFARATSREQRQRLDAQIDKLQHNYPGGLEAYLKTAKTLLEQATCPRRALRDISPLGQGSCVHHGTKGRKSIDGLDANYTRRPISESTKADASTPRSQLHLDGCAGALGPEQRRGSGECRTVVRDGAGFPTFSVNEQAAKGLGGPLRIIKFPAFYLLTPPHPSLVLPSRQPKDK